MRRVHRLEIAVGLLVLVGLGGAVALVLTADKVRVQRTYEITAWLEDAGGLRFESPVTLAGIQVGKVVDIHSAGLREKGKVKARLKIDEGVRIPHDVQARLVSSGVFGDSFLALTPSDKADGTILSLDGSGDLVVQPGFFDEAATQVRGILGGVHELLDAENKAAAKRLIVSAASVAESAAAITKRLEDDRERIGRILENLDATAASLRVTAEAAAARTGTLLDRADRLMALAEDRLPGTLSRADLVLESASAVAQRVDAVLVAQGPAISGTLQSLSEAAAKGSRVLAALDSGQGVLGQLLVNRDLARDLHAMAVDLGSAAEQVADRPSRLVFDDVESTQAMERLRRDREKMRRTLDEGLAPAATAPAGSSSAATPAP